MKPGSVVVDLAAEQGGNCDLTKPGKKYVTKNGVTIIGYTDFPSRMATQSSTLYSNNIRHMLTDLTPGQGRRHPPEHGGRRDPRRDRRPRRRASPSRRRGPRSRRSPSPPPRPRPRELTPEEKRAAELAAFQKTTRTQVGLLIASGLLMLLIGSYAPASFMAHFIVFVLAVFIGFQVIWNVAHSLHTPLMSVTNAISGIIIVGALLQVGSGNFLVILLAAISILIASINIVGGFLVTRRMLAMFQKS